MSSYLLADTNHLLPESSYLPSHTTTSVNSRICVDGVARKDHDQTLNFGRLAKAEARDTTCLSVCRRGLWPPVKSYM
jgi:hypothetical protein